MAKTVIVYWSSTGNVEYMAQQIELGVSEVNDNVKVVQVLSATEDDIVNAEKVMLGCSATGEEEIDVMEFRPFFDSIKELLADKPVALFGSWGWGEGEYMRKWEEEVRETGANLFEDQGYTHQDALYGNEEEAIDFGRRFANS